MKTATGFERARKLTATLPEVEVGIAWGTPALKVKGKMFACIPTNRAAEPNSLVVCVDFAQRDELIAADPEAYYLKEHYEDYPAVLVRLPKIRDDALRDLLLMAWKFVASRAKQKRGSRSRRRS